MLVASTALRRGFTQFRTSSHPLSCTRWISFTTTGDKYDDDGSNVNNKNNTNVTGDMPTKGNAPKPTFPTSSSLKHRPRFGSEQGLEDLEEKSLRPSVVQKELDRHIVGQDDAKRAVAIAMRNRWRRKQLPAELRKEVTPRNVLMIGPTGCGKTEVARRMAALGGAPFIKVEATKFTEVGYHGRDVDSIISDLVETSISLTKKHKTEELKGKAEKVVEERILDYLINIESKNSRHSLRDMLREGLLDDLEIDIEIELPTNHQKDQGNLFGKMDPDAEKKRPQITTILLPTAIGKKGANNAKTKHKRIPIAEAKETILISELEKLLENTDITKEALTAVEENGIVFFDEIDKICAGSDSPKRGGDASDEGVQRDLLPLVEGTTISTKHGNVKTDFILFVASGAFHAVKPSDMLPELQGRLPIRVELQGLTEDDLYRILTEPVSNLIRQQVELLATEGVTLEFENDAIKEIARMAALVNRNVENIGARRLYTIMERVMEELSFDAAELGEGSFLTVKKTLVEERLSDIVSSTDQSRYIL